MHSSLLKSAQVMFYILNLFLGISMTYLGLSIQKEMAGDTSQCPASVREANTGVIVLGVVLLTATVFMMWSNHTYKNCSMATSDVTSTHLTGYYCFVLFISIVLTTLGAVMKDDVDKATSSDSCKKIKTKANFIMTVGIIGIVLTLGPLALMTAFRGGSAAYQKHKAMKSSAA